MNVRFPGPILSSLLLLLLPLAAASCSGGGASTSGAIVGCADGGQGLCVTRCNLGCNATGCSISNIAVNQRLDFTFNLEIDPATVDTNTIKIRDASGDEPIGDFLVQGATISFIPVVAQSGGETFFGFKAQETYTLTIPAKGSALDTLKSTSGDALVTDFTCRLQVTRGIVDFDGQPPRAAMLIPETLGKTCIDRQTLILIEFSELIDPQTLAETANGLLFRLAQADQQGRCSSNQITLPGVRTLSVDKITQRTRVTFRPAFEPPGGFCIVVEVTDTIRDLSQKRARPNTFSFVTCAGDVPTREIVEDFSDPFTADPIRSGGKWVKGAVPAPTMGGSGRHGDFDYSLVATDLAQKDSRDREIWQINVDDVTIPKVLTLSGEDEKIQNGIFEFTSFTVPQGINLRFVGNTMPLIRVTGTLEVSGVLDLPSELATKLVGSGGRPPTSGQPGFKGAIGGAAGGRGGDSPNKIGSKVTTGTVGENVKLPTGHPLTAQAAGTGGTATGPNPSSGLDKDVKFSAYSNVISQTVTSGGGGGGYVTPGQGGSSEDNKRGTETPQSFDFSTAGMASKSIPMASLTSRQEKSSFLYLIGGSGGGGSGPHPSSAYDASGFEPVNWSPGSGGAGGGGILHLQVGGDLNVGLRGSILVRGGDGQVFVSDQINFTNPAPGGAGSGGSLLMQVGGIPDVRGSILATGGDGGRYNSWAYQLRVDSLSGAGGDGFLRFESNPPPALAALTNLRPAMTADNVGTIHVDDVNTLSMIATEWYDTGLFFPPKFVRYVIEATIDNQPVVFSDDPTLGRSAVFGEPVEILFQGAQLDALTKRPDPKSLSSWFSGTFDALTSAGGNAFRVLVRFDKSKAQSIVLNKITYVYKG